MSKQYFSVLPLLILLGLIMTGANSAQLGAKETKNEDFDNNLAPGQMALHCAYGGQSVWRFNDQTVLGNSQLQQMFNINGGSLSNRKATSGEYNGKYLCLDGSGDRSGVEYTVRISGTSNLSTGAIVGIVFAVIFAVIIIVVGLYLAHKNGYLGGDSQDYDENDKLQGHDVEVDDYDRNSHAGRFRNTGQTSMLN